MWDSLEAQCLRTLEDQKVEFLTRAEGSGLILFAGDNDCITVWNEKALPDKFSRPARILPVNAPALGLVVTKTNIIHISTDSIL